MSSPSLPLCRRQLPLPVGNRPTKKRPPLRPVLPPLLAVGLAASGNPLRVPYCRPPLRAGRNQSCPQTAAAPMGERFRASNRPLAGSLGHSRLPLQLAWPWPATPARSLVVAGCPSTLRSAQWIWHLSCGMLKVSARKSTLATRANSSPPEVEEVHTETTPRMSPTPTPKRPAKK
ncbi:hypothetical protein GW17_00002223 [Ensete ventricosum]|nr:hypothetical protein GW17_00002223 [Ensete ventricosum]